MKPPSGSPRTEFRPIGSGAITQPTQVASAVAAHVDVEHLDRLALAVADREHPLDRTASREQTEPCVVNFSGFGGPGQSL